MAQYWLNAEDFAVTTDIETLGYDYTLYLNGAAALSVVDIGGSKFFQSSVNSGNHAQVAFNDIAPVADCEILMLQQIAASSVDSQVSIGMSFRPSLSIGFTPSWAILYQSLGGVVTRNKWGTYTTTTTDTIPPDVNLANHTGFRGRISGNNVYGRFWQHASDLISNEPGTWNFEAITNGSQPATGYPAAIKYGQNQSKMLFNILAIGTNGDAAPTSAPAQQTVSIPTNLQTQSITSSGALLNWD